jgi:hypothetical protein
MYCITSLTHSVFSLIPLGDKIKDSQKKNVFQERGGGMRERGAVMSPLKRERQNRLVRLGTVRIGYGGVWLDSGYPGLLRWWPEQVAEDWSCLAPAPTIPVRGSDGGGVESHNHCQRWNLYKVVGGGGRRRVFCRLCFFLNFFGPVVIYIFFLAFIL